MMERKNHTMKAAMAAALLLVSPAMMVTNAFSTTAPVVKTAFHRKISPVTVNMYPMTRSAKTQLSMATTKDTADDQKQNKSTNPSTPVLWSLLQDSDAKTAVAATMLALMVSLAPLSANAAMSGGRMGGSFSAPRMGGGGYSRSMPMRSSYSAPRGSYYSRPNVGITPYYSPFYSPFGYGGGAAMGYRGGGFSLFPLLALGAAASVLSNVMAPSRSLGGGDWSSLGSDETSSLGAGTSVVQVTVALQVPDRDDSNSILSVLDRLAQTARTDSRVGIQNLTSQVALELLRRKSSIASAATRYKHFKNRDQAQRDFNQVSVTERSKFEQETVSKYGGVDYSSDENAKAAGSGAEGATMAVVTLILAIDGDSTTVGPINSISSVEEALRKIASDAKVDDCLQSAEILWTPETRTETLSARDVIADYPELRSV